LSYICRNTDFEKFKDLIINHNLCLELENIDPLLYKLCLRCWDREPENRPTFKELIGELQVIRTEIVLPETLCPLAGTLWKKTFLQKGKVRFDEFVTEVIKEIKPTTQTETLNKYISCLTDLFSASNNSTKGKEQKLMSVHKFSKLLKWFGPLVKGQSTLFDNLSYIMSQKWFFGIVSSNQAEQRLDELPSGSFFIRLNSGESVKIEEAPFTISVVSDRGPLHIRAMTSKHGGLWCKFDQTKIPSQPTITELIVRLLEKGLIKKICGGHPFKAHAEKSRYLPNTDEDEED